jgi:lysophospholipase L1-like esterase
MSRLLLLAMCTTRAAGTDCNAANFEPDTDYHDGQGIGHAAATNVANCCAQCSNASLAAKGCKYFTYTSDGQCWFKLDDTGRRAVKGATSGSCVPPVPTPPPPPIPPTCPDTTGTRLNVGCVGDSITAGAHAGGRSHAWPEQLQAMLDAPGATTAGKYCVTNLGESGSTVQKRPHGDSPYWDRTSFTTLTAHKWDIVVLMLGTNDAKDACNEVGNCGYTCRNTTCCNWPHAGQNTTLQSNITWSQDCSNTMTCPFVTDYRAMIDHIRTLGRSAGKSPDLWLAVPPPLMSSSVKSKPYGMNQTIINDIFPALIPRINSAAGMVHSAIDVFGAMGGAPNLDCGTGAAAARPQLCNHSCVASSHNPACALQCDPQSCDACHPNANGYTVLAKTILDAVF